METNTMETNTVARPKEVYRRVKVTYPAIKTERGKTFGEKLKDWIERENLSENRLKWVGISMVVQSVFITPLVALVIMQTGNHIIFWISCTAAMYLTFLPSLSGISVKSLLKTFFAATVINLVTVISAAGVFFFS